MQISEILDKLESLQQVLVEKYDIESKMEELPKSLVGSTESLEQFKKEYIEKNAEYESEKAKVTALKLELDEAVKDREAGEKNMDSIDTHREYDILSNQIKEAQNRENSLRKELAKEEKILAEQKENLDSEEELIKATEKDVEESKASIDQEMNSYKSQLGDLEKQEAKHSEGIEPEILFKFQRIILRNRKGIVPVRGNVCDGCHMILPAQFANEVHRGDKILFCPYCSRILRYEEDEGVESTFFSMDEAGSLADLDDEDLLDEDQEGLDLDSDGDGEDRGDDEKSSMDYDE
ncbi:MAG: nucleic acid-binding protein [Treponema sp.]|nr:nucleic acid-binding protein [Treponema sp.]MBR4385910.1 nucleic acid-binding protein [Treponema sp.]